MGAMTNSLPNATNMAKMYPGRSKICQRCGEHNQTLGHVLGNCCISMNIASESPYNRITWRHNSILRNLKESLIANKIKNRYEILDDLPGSSYIKLPERLNPRMSGLRPDLILESRDIMKDGKKEVWIIELTSCMEGNITQWHEKKRAKYATLALELSEKYVVHNCPIEVGALGFVPDNIKHLLGLLHYKEPQNKIACIGLSRVALECSSRIFTYRNTIKSLEI